MRFRDAQNPCYVHFLQYFHTGNHPIRSHHTLHKYNAFHIFGILGIPHPPSNRRYPVFYSCRASDYPPNLGEGACNSFCSKKRQTSRRRPCTLPSVRRLSTCCMLSNNRAVRQPFLECAIPHTGSNFFLGYFKSVLIPRCPRPCTLPSVR